MSVDEEGICVGLGSSGDLEFWNRRTNERVWRYRVPRGGGNIFFWQGGPWENFY